MFTAAMNNVPSPCPRVLSGPPGHHTADLPSPTAGASGSSHAGPGQPGSVRGLRGLRGQWAGGALGPETSTWRAPAVEFLFESSALWIESRPPQRDHIDVLTPGSWQCDHIWK